MKKTKTIYADKELLERLQKIAESQSQSLNRLICSALEFYLQKKQK